MIPINCKITLSFPYTCLFREITIINFWHAPNNLLVENLLASTFHIYSFSAHYTVLWTENNIKTSLQSMQSLQKIWNAQFQSARPSYWYKNGCVAVTRCIITLSFVLNVWLTFWTFGYHFKHLANILRKE